MYRQLDPAAQSLAMLQAIQSLVPADSVVLNRFEVATGKYTAETLPRGITTPEITADLGRHLHESPFPAYYVATGDPQWKMTTDFMPLEDFRETMLYRAMQRWRIEVQMCGMLAFADGVAHAITVNRSAGTFSEKERELLNVLHPHAVTSYLNALASEKASGTVSRLRTVIDTAPGAYGYFEAQGRTAWMQPRAEAWLAEFFPGELFHEGLPASVEGLAKKIREEEREAGHLEVKGTVENLFVSITASALGGWILRMERRPVALPPRFGALPTFSPRENEVLRWMVEGKRNAEIATLLSISIRTVEKHVAAILEGFGVENRATAIVRAMEAYAALCRSGSAN
jgi:DNA-binding CsgD family transcriptional regulator